MSPASQRSTARRLAWLAMDSEAGWSIDTGLAIEPLADLGWAARAIRWRSETPDWNEFDAVYVGVPWDYPEDPDRFIAVLETIDRSRALLVNPLPLLRWGMTKTYLRDLEQRGAAIVPTLWPAHMERRVLQDAFERFACDRIVVKPVVGANAVDAFVLTPADLDGAVLQLAQTFSERAFMVQPFIAGVQVDGEYSLFWFDGELSHAVRKVPAAGDFRVQEERGATIEAIEPAPDLRAAAGRTLALVDPAPAYARLDFVRGDAGAWLLMELELVEPSLYLRMDPLAARRFALAFDRYVRRLEPS